MSTISKVLPNPPANFSTTLSSGISSNALEIPLNSVSGLNTEGVGIIYAKNTDGNPIASSIEFIHWTNISGNSLILTDTGDRGLTGSASGAQAHNAGDTFEVWLHPKYHFYDFATTEHNQDGTHGDITATSVFTDTVSTDTVNEKTSGSGVTVDGVLLKDSEVSTDTVREKTSGSGVTVDEILVKDNTVTVTGGSTNASLDLKGKGTGKVRAYANPLSGYYNISQDWELIYINSFTSQTNDVTISNLDGNTDKLYKIIIEGTFSKNSDVYIAVRPNGDSGSNYATNRYYVYNISGGGNIRDNASGYVTGMVLAGNGWSDTVYLTGEMTLQAICRGSSRRTSFTQYQFNRATVSTDLFFAVLNSVWTNTSSNITSLVINFGTGTFTGTIAVYRLIG